MLLKFPCEAQKLSQKQHFFWTFWTWQRLLRISSPRASHESAPEVEASLLAKLRWKMQPGCEGSWPGNRLQAGHGWRGEQEGSLWWRSRRRRWWLRAGGGLRGVRGVRLHHLRDQQDGRRAEEEEKVVQWEGTLRDAKAPNKWWSKVRLSRKLGSFGHSTTSLLLAEEYLWLDCRFISKYTIYQQFIFQCWNHIIKITTTSGCF